MPNSNKKRKGNSPLSAGKASSPKHNNNKQNGSSTSKKNHDQKKKGKSQQPPAKQLSGSLLGMRFMQRKAKAQEAATAAAEEMVKRRRLDMDDDDINIERNTKSTTGASSGVKNENKQQQQHLDLSRMEESGQDEQQENLLRQFIPVHATDADMYGIEADIIGRRSFGGFNTSVQTTWQAAYVARQKLVASEGSNKATLTDDELLRRYEKYVMGTNK